MADFCVWLGEEAGDAGRDDGTGRERTELGRGIWWCARRCRGGGLGGALRAARGAVRASGVGTGGRGGREGIGEESRVCHGTVGQAKFCA